MEDSEPATATPLNGVRVVDLTTVLLGPYAAQMLGDYGADVIKIEGPEGDSTRATGPARERGMAATFLGANSNKRSVVLDLKQSLGRDALLALLAQADVLLCSVRTQKMRSLGLDPEGLRDRFPRLVVVAIVGFGEQGPYAGRPAYDDIIQGLCGMASLNERQGGDPAYVPSVIADKTCALFATQAVLMALVQRATTGRGCHVQVPMFEAMTGFTLVEHLYGRSFEPPEDDAGYSRLLTRWRKPYLTSDGHVCIVPYSTQHWVRFFDEAGRPDVMQDERFGTLAARTRNIDALYAELAACTPARSTREWLEACDRLDIPAAPMHSIEQLESDPHLRAIAFFRRFEDPAMGTVILPTAPLRFDGAPARKGMPPRLGEHTVCALREAGVDAETIHQLLVAGAAAQAPTGNPMNAVVTPDEVRNSADAYAPRQEGLYFPSPPRFTSTAEERLHRKQRLAAACRVFARFGFEYGFAGHVTVRDPEHPDCFWTNPFAMDLARVRVSDLLLVDHDGQVLEGNWTVNRAGFVLHSAIHAAHPHVLSSCHLHSVNGMAWAAFGEPLAPLNQTACYFHEDQAVITEGSGRVALESGAADAIAQALGTAKIAIHQNHGLFAVGRESVDEAAWWFLSAERACEIQLKVDASGRAPKPVPHERALHISRQLATPSIAWLHFQPHYDAVCRSDPDLFE